MPASHGAEEQRAESHTQDEDGREPCEGKASAVVAGAASRHLFSREHRARIQVTGVLFASYIGIDDLGGVAHAWAARIGRHGIAASAATTSSTARARQSERCLGADPITTQA